MFLFIFQTQVVCTCSDNLELLFWLLFSFMEIDNCGNSAGPGGGGGEGGSIRPSVSPHFQT